MPALDPADLAAAIAAAWKTIAGGHWSAVRDLAREDIAFVEKSAVHLADDLVHGRITQEQAALERDDMIESLRGLQDVLAVEGKILAQDLINSALGIIGGAVNRAVGFALF